MATKKNKFLFHIGTGVLLNHFVSFPVSSGDLDLTMMINNGIWWSRIRADIFEMYKRNMVYKGMAQIKINGILKPKQIVDFTFTIKGKEYTEEFVVVTNEELDALSENGTTAHGILGGKFLSAHKWIVDYENNKLYEAIPLIKKKSTLGK